MSKFDLNRSRPLANHDEKDIHEHHKVAQNEGYGGQITHKDIVTDLMVAVQ